MSDRTPLPADENGNLLRAAINDDGEITWSAARANAEGSTFRTATNEEIQAADRFAEGLDTDPKPESHPDWT